MSDKPSVAEERKNVIGASRRSAGERSASIFVRSGSAGAAFFAGLRAGSLYNSLARSVPCASPLRTGLRERFLVTTLKAVPPGKPVPHRSPRRAADAGAVRQWNRLRQPRRRRLGLGL